MTSQKITLTVQTEHTHYGTFDALLRKSRYIERIKCVFSWYICHFQIRISSTYTDKPTELFAVEILLRIQFFMNSKSETPFLH